MLSSIGSISHSSHGTAYSPHLYNLGGAGRLAVVPGAGGAGTLVGAEGSGGIADDHLTRRPLAPYIVFQAKPWKLSPQYLVVPVIHLNVSIFDHSVSESTFNHRMITALKQRKRLKSCPSLHQGIGGYRTKAPCYLHPLLPSVSHRSHLQSKPCLSHTSTASTLHYTTHAKVTPHCLKVPKVPVCEFIQAAALPAPFHRLQE